MPRSRKAKPEPATNEELAKLLPAVFGKEILIDTEYMKERRSRYNDMTTVKNSAWYLYYTGDIVILQSDIPRPRAREIAKSIRRQLQYSASYEKKQKQLPKLEELIDDYLVIHVAPLRAFAAAGVSLISRDFSPIKWVMDLALEHEKDWRNFEKYMTSQADDLILSRTDEITDEHPSFFTYETRDRDDPVKQQLFMKIGVPIGLWRHPDVDKDTSIWQLGWKAENIFNPRAKELGIDHLFKYESFHEGTHASRDEERLIMQAISTEGLVLKLAELRQPETLAKVQTFFREVLYEMSPEHYVPYYPIEWWTELEKRVPHPEDIPGKKADYKAFFDAREQAGKQLLEERPDYVVWHELANSFMEDNKTIGDMLKVLRNPPPGKEAACNEMKAYLYKTLPLLADDIQPIIPVRPQPQSLTDNLTAG